MLKYRLRKISRKKLIIWSTMIMVFVISLGSIVGFYALATFENQQSSGIIGDTVYVNDLEADWNYYMGLNFTKVTTRASMPEFDADLYNEENLVKVQINYKGDDINDNDLIGYVSSSEKQSNFVYYKYYPIEDGYINIELIDNPYSMRPVGKGFNGWVCNASESGDDVCDDSNFYYDSDYYLRNLKVRVNGRNSIIVTLNASWISAKIVTGKSSENTVYSVSMRSAITNTRAETIYGHPCNYKFKTDYDYYILMSASKGETYTGYEIDFNQNDSRFALRYRTDFVCEDESCTYLVMNTSNDYELGKYYFVDTGETDTITETQIKMVEQVKQEQVFDENGDAVLDSDGNPTYQDVLDENGNVVYEEVPVEVEVIITRNIFEYTTYNPNNDASVHEDFTKKYYDYALCDIDSYSKISEKVGELITHSNYDHGSSLGALYYRTSYSSSQKEYLYNNTGQSCASDGVTCSGTVYKLIQYNDSIKNKNETISTWNNRVTTDSNHVLSVENNTTASNYYYLVTRDTNIVIFEKKSERFSDYDDTTKPFTLTADCDGTRNPSNYAVNFYDGYNFAIKSDMVLENLVIDSENGYDGNRGAFNGAYTYFLNYFNVKIGRTFRQINSNNTTGRSIFAGYQYSNIGDGKAKFIIEGGNYHWLLMMPYNGYNDIFGASLKVTLGSDYDRVTNNNSKLYVYGRYQESERSSYHYNSSYDVTTASPSSSLVVKSGTYGDHGTNYSGIYVSSLNSGNNTAYRTAKIEGGEIRNLIGGLCFDGTKVSNSITISMYVTGGRILNVLGGAGISGADGNRVISITGGTVRNAVAGGSNGNAVDWNTCGALNGDTLVYIGGNAVIGDGTKANGIETSGSVFGGGYGRSGETTCGVARTSHVIINGATINGDVFGSGNFGAISGKSNSDSKIQIDILNGDIKGNVYGGGNKAGAGSSSKLVNVDINIYGGNLNNVYGGSNSSGTIYGDINLSLHGGNMDDVYGGGKGNNTSMLSGRKVIIASETQNDSDLKVNELYGGSELGLVRTTNVTIDGGTFNSIYGGGKGNSSVKPSTIGSINVKVVDGDINNVFGGTNINGSVPSSTSYTMKVNVTGGNIDNVFGGSNGVGATAVDTNVSVTGGTINNVYGGGNKAVTSTTKVNIDGGLLKTAVYGGGKEAAVTGSSLVNVSGGIFAEFDVNENLLSFSEIFGGGEAATVTTTTVNIEEGANVYNVYGGSNVSGKVNTTNVNNNAGTVICNTYGGGKIAEVTTANNNLNGSIYRYKPRPKESTYDVTCGIAFGGGANADVTTANVTVNSGSLINVYGGSNAGGIVTRSNVKVNGGTIENIFGGNNQGGETVDSVVEINPNGQYMRLYNVFGGSNGIGASIRNTTTTNIKSGTISGDVFGGGNQAPVIKKTTVNMYGGTVGSLYGGGNRAPIGDVVTNSSGVLITGNAVGNTNVNVLGGNVLENVYGSGNASFVYGTTSVKVGDYAKTALKDTTSRELYIKGSVFAGSETNADASTTYDDSYEGVTGPAGSGTGLVEIDGKSYIVNDVSKLNIDGSIYGSGNNSKVVNGSNVYIKNFGTKNNPVIATSIQRASNVYITDSHIELNGMVDRADPNSYRYSLIRLDELNLLGTSRTTGTYLYLRQGSTFLKTFKSGKMSGDTFTPQTVTGNAGSLTTGVSDNRLYMLTNKVLSVSNSAAPIYDNTSTQAGKVTGMTYLGMYTHETDKEFVRGIYDYSYGNGSTYDSVKSGVISDTAYTFVYGLNDRDLTMDKEIKTDGFYTSIVQNEVDGETNHGKRLVYDYVGVTPANETTLYYKWVLGYEPVEIIVDLIADKYSESGAVNALISLEELRETITNADGSTVSQEWRDAILTIQSVDTTNFGATTADATRAFDGLLVDKADIPTVNTDDKNNDGVVDANNYFALSMGTTSTGWLDNYKTNFYDNDYVIDNNFCDAATGNCNGNQIYTYDSTTKQRNLSFWLYHSKNLDFSYVDKLKDPTNMLIPMNSVYIDVEFRNPHGDPTSTSSTQPVRITVNISLSDGELDKYGGVIAPGKKYEMFQGRPTTIAANGSFSVYQSLSLDLTKTIAGSATGEKWDVGKIYHQEKTVEITDAYGVEKTVEWSESYRYLASSYLLPVGTVITMLDLKNNEQYYYEVTQENYDQKAADYGGKKEYKYFLTDFIRMGSTTDTNKFDDDMNEEDSTKYYYKDEMSELAVEEFVFSVDFAGANVQVQNPDGDQHYFFLQLAREEDGVEKTVISTNGTPTNEMIYTLKPQVSSQISTEGGYVQEDGSITNDTTIYVGESAQLNLDTTLIQLDENDNLLIGVSDTKFDDYKLGAKITVKRAKLDENGNVVYDSQNNIVYEDVTSDLFGTVMEINGRTYYPQTDGSTRLELAGRITDVLSNINIDFSNSSLSYGDYVLVVETFVSYDGLYYGDFEATRNEFPFELLNNQYGLDVKTETHTQVTHDVNTGEDANGDREIHYLVNVINGLANPNLKISIERRDYSNFYETNYQMIPITNIVEEIRIGESTENIITAQNTCFVADTDGNCYEYNLGTINNDSVITTYDVYMKLKNGPDINDLGNNKPNSKWKSGTYRVIYSLYDGDVKVGDFYEYLIIRSLGVNEVVIEGSGK